VVYRWDFASDTLSQRVRLTDGLGEAYTPTTIGADGTIYAINDAVLFAVGQASNLAIQASHTGEFSYGQTGATYTLSVANSGAGATNGAVVVQTSVPAGLTATQIAGDGWACTQPTGPCVRSDGLGAGGSYAGLTLTVSVGSNPPPAVNLIATVSADGAANSVNSVAIDPTVLGPFTCDLNGDIGVNVLDLQEMVNEALQIAPPLHDLNHDGKVDVADVVKEAAAVLGLGCQY